MKQGYRHDMIAVLGNGFTPTWELQPHMQHRLALVAQMYKNFDAPRIAVCGKWSIEYTRRGIVPPVTEFAQMKKVLLESGVPKEAVFTERDSEDSLGNVYNLKKHIVRPLGIKKILLVCSDYQAERVAFLGKKVFGPDYEIFLFPTVTPFADDPEAIASQRDLLVKQMDYLKNMKDGNDSFLEGKLYTDPEYPKSESAAYYAMGRHL